MIFIDFRILYSWLFSYASHWLRKLKGCQNVEFFIFVKHHFEKKFASFKNSKATPIFLLRCYLSNQKKYHMAYFIKFFKMSVGWDPDNDKNYTWLESEHRRRIIQKKRQRSSLLFEAQNVSIPCRASYFALGRFRRIGFIHPFLQIILVQFISSQNSSDDLYLFFCNYPSSMDQNHCTTKGIILMCRCLYYYLLSAVIILCRRKTLSFSFLGSERWLYRKS